MKHWVGWVVGAWAASGFLGCAAHGAYYAEPEFQGSGGGASEGMFYDTLSPYGEWMAVQGLGEVWRPSPEVVGSAFVPYTSAGHWVYTNFGWSFESDYPWGWAAFHYGRWYSDPSSGWVWAPDTVWGPAWVDWRFGGGYAGWAPLAPAGIVSAGYRPYWSFVQAPYLVAPNVYTYLLPPASYPVAFGASVGSSASLAYGSARYLVGPPPALISAAAGHPIEPVLVRPPVPGNVRPVAVSPPTYARSNPAYRIPPVPVVGPSVMAAAGGRIPGARPAPVLPIYHASYAYPGAPLRAAPYPRFAPGQRDGYGAARPVYPQPAYPAPVFRAPPPRSRAR